jgi:hypothetical protein
VPAGATPLLFGECLQRNLNYGCPDTYVFQAGSGQMLSLSMRAIASNTLRPQVWVFGPNGEMVSSASGQDQASIDSLLVTTTGEHTVIAKDAPSRLRGGNYEICLKLGMTPVEASSWGRIKIMHRQLR